MAAGVVKHWELIIHDTTGKHTSTYRTWDSGFNAFDAAKQLKPYSATLSACSGKYASRKITTHEYREYYGRQVPQNECSQ